MRQNIIAKSAGVVLLPGAFANLTTRPHDSPTRLRDRHDAGLRPLGSAVKAGNLLYAGLIGRGGPTVCGPVENGDSAKLRERAEISASSDPLEPHADAADEQGQADEADDQAHGQHDHRHAKPQSQHHQDEADNDRGRVLQHSEDRSPRDDV
jgi:hypothetical protein